MKLKIYGFLYIGLAFAGWFLDDMLRMMRLLTSFCYQDRLTNVTLSSEGNCADPHVSHQIIHERDPQAVKHFNARMSRTVKNQNEDGTDIPQTFTFHGLSHIAIWRSGKNPKASAWNESIVVEGPGWVAPRGVVEYERLQGDFVAHFSWFEGNFGHFFDDSLTQIAFLRNQFSNNTKWILCDTELARNVIAFLDPDFYQRIHWVKMALPITVDGSLTVAIQPRIPNFSGCCRPYDHLRQWVAEKHPLVPELKKIVYYSRNCTDTHHWRMVEENHEKQLLQRIRQAMIRYNLKEELVIFTGQDENGNTLPIAEQFEIFRSARTIIGPHGAGMLGNILWTNPYPTSCSLRTNIIEFVPGLNSTQVHPLYRSLFIRWRKWPLDFHVLLYKSESTKEETFIDLDSLDDALNDAWGSVTDQVTSLE